MNDEPIIYILLSSLVTTRPVTWRPAPQGKSRDRRPFLWRLKKKRRLTAPFLPLGTHFWPAPPGNLPTETPIVTALWKSKSELFNE